MIRYIALISLLSSAPLYAQCFSFQGKQRGFVAQKQFIVQEQIIPNVYYFVGAPLRAEAVVEKAKRDDPDWKAFQQFKAFQEFQKSAAVEPDPEDSPTTLPTVSDVFASRCVSCHNANDSAGGYALDGSMVIDAEAKAQIMESVLSGRMPKGKEPLNPEELGELVDHLFLERKGF